MATDEFVGRYEMGRLVKEQIPDVQASRVNGLTTTADALWLCTAFRGVLSWNGNTLTSHRQPENPAGSARAFSRTGTAACGRASAAAASRCTSTAACGR